MSYRNRKGHETNPCFQNTFVLIYPLNSRESDFSAASAYQCHMPLFSLHSLPSTPFPPLLSYSSPFPSTPFLSIFSLLSHLLPSSFLPFLFLFCLLSSFPSPPPSPLPFFLLSPVLNYLLFLPPLPLLPPLSLSFPICFFSFSSFSYIISFIYSVGITYLGCARSCISES